MKYVLPILIALGSSSAKAFNTVFVGDSHSYGQFGEEIDKYLRSVSKNVTSIAGCGSSPSTWMADGKKFKSTNCGYWRRDIKGQEIRVKEHQVDSFSKELSALHPDLTVIALGTNILSTPTNILSEKKSIQAMLDTIKKNDSECIWIGPPDTGNKTLKLNLADGVKEIKALVEKANCAFVDSSELTKYPAGKSDGIHYGPKDSAEWGKKVVAKIEKLPQVSRAREKVVQPLLEEDTTGTTSEPGAVR
ncbi:SGNH/GDSL hydrolase family protein [Bdellovibrio sp. ZAP7]|uniref:SGNH/GDSL hydrolase family protein n=1 Tax=Bdellovibrio sp. ZAP7 TaxID=2231053 RepID=UPI001AEF83D9|nr:SGNH/GDSL hydrolase family protein [Bdellovibrio sp. ZAP7]